MRATQITDPCCYHAEGPVWWPRWNTLRWVDMLAGDVMTLTDSGPQRTHVGAKVAAGMRPRAGAGAVVAREHDIAVADHDDLSDLRVATSVIADPNIRLNETGVDPQGRLYAGTMAYDRTRYVANYYRVDRVGGEPRVVIPQTSTSNGLAWTPDGSRAYYNDTSTRCTQAFDYDPDHGLFSRRIFVNFLAEDGHPDGLCVDADGGVWVAMNGMGEVRHYDARGLLLDVVTVVPRKVTSCCFGGDDLATLFITTSREKLQPGEDPLAGSVWALPGAGCGAGVADVAF